MKMHLAYGKNAGDRSTGIYGNLGYPDGSAEIPARSVVYYGQDSMENKGNHYDDALGMFLPMYHFSFCGVFGFSIMFNSPWKLAATAALIGAVANTLRLELVDLASFPPAAATFAGALLAGILASLIKNQAGYPRISLTVPSIVIMVPGLYLYRAIYNLGAMSLNTSASWFASAILIIVALPLGLIFARILTDRTFRYCT